MIYNPSLGSHAGPRPRTNNNTLAIDNVLQRSRIGRVTVFRLINYVDSVIEVRESQARADISIALSGDGKVLALSFERSMSNAEYVQVFRFEQGGWAQLGADLDGDKPANR